MSKRTDRVRHSTRRPMWEAPEPLTYEAAVLAHSPHLAGLLAPVVDERGGRR